MRRQRPRTAWTKGDGPPTKFKPGQSGNPGGRPKAMQDLVEAAREHTIAAIDRLVKLMEQDEDRDVALAAVAELLNRGWGRPAVAILAQVNGQIAVGGIDRPPRESLEQWLERRRRSLTMLDGPQPEHVQPVSPSSPQPPSGSPPPNGETAPQGERPQARVAERPGAAGSTADSAGPSTRSMTPQEADWLAIRRRELGIEPDDAPESKCQALAARELSRRRAASQDDRAARRDRARR